MNIDDLPGAGPACVPMDVRRVQAESVEAAQDHVAEETPIALVYNGQPFAVMLGTPLDLEDFALGFTWTEGIIASLEEFHGVEVEAEETGFSVYDSVPHERVEALAARRRSLTGRTGCGLCGRQMLEDALRPVASMAWSEPVAADTVARAHEGLAAGQTLNALTGAVHAAGWADRSGNIALVREDVGRHNALDKLIGALLRSGLPRADGLVVVTSRASYEMVQKTASAGIGILSAVSAPTALAVRTARAAGLTLLGFSRGGRHTVYAPVNDSP